MKTIIKYLIALTLVNIATTETYSQCIADAGENMVVCNFNSSGDTIYLGGNPVVQGGIPPYTYSWFCELRIGNLHFTTPYFLNDSTLPNPRIIGDPSSGAGAVSMTYYLMVTDSAGNICTDSVILSFSKFTTTFEDKYRIISQGDSVRLYPGIGGGMPPLTYHWSPENNLSDPNVAQPWASPDSSIAYMVTVTDSVGCFMTDPDYFEVSVIITSSVGENLNRISNKFIFPNPTHRDRPLRISTPIQEDVVITFYDILGRFLFEEKTNRNMVWLPQAFSFTGICIYTITRNGELIGKGKLLIN